MKFTATLLSLFAVTSFGHSWLECADYRGTISTPQAFSEAQCAAVGRSWNALFGSATNQFGDDRGYNYQPGNGRTCRDARTTDAANYPGGFKAQYVQGATYRLVWPAKNHARIRDFGLKVFAACGNQRTALEANINALNGNQFLIQDFGTNTNNGAIGFGNCGSLSNTDRAVCFGDLTIPNTLSGECTFVWYWPFNSNQDIYTTCWDATVSATGSAPPAPAPVPTPAPTPTPAPGTGGSCAEPQAIYQQCGGVNHPASRSCCQTGLSCNVLNVHYSQCLPSSAASEISEQTEQKGVDVKLVVVGVAGGVGLVALVVAGMIIAKSRRTNVESHVALTEQI